MADITMFDGPVTITFKRSTATASDRIAFRLLFDIVEILTPNCSLPYNNKTYETNSEIFTNVVPFSTYPRNQASAPNSYFLKFQVFNLTVKNEAEIAA